MTLRVGMGQMLVEGGEPDRNLGRAARMIAEAGRRGCALVLLPECLDLGWTHPSATRLAEPIPGPRVEVLRALAAEHRVYVCAGLTERAGARIHNAAVLLDPSGDLLLHHRKINVLAEALDLYAVGDRLGVVDTPLGRIGLDICSDNYRDALEIGGVLGRMGAQILLSPSSWTVDYDTPMHRDPYGEKWKGPYLALARTFGMVVLGTTAVGYLVGGPFEGRKMVGASLAVGPEGVIAEGPRNELAGELVVVDVPVPVPNRRGTEIGRHLDGLGKRYLT